MSGTGGPLFAGVEGVDPLAPPQEIWTAVLSVINPTDPPDVIAARVSDWFAPGGDFDTIAYRGGDAGQVLLANGGRLRHGTSHHGG